MSNSDNRLVIALAAMTALGTAPAWAQAPAAPAPAPAAALAQVTIDNVPYVLPADAAKNTDAVKVLIAVAEQQGMVRNVVRTLGGTIDTLEFRGSGLMGGQQVNFIVSYDYRTPSIRQDVTKADKTREVTVASGELSWDETKPGVFLQAGKTPAAERVMPLWLLPPFVVHEGAANAGSIKLATASGMKVLTIPVPRYKSEVKATIDAKNQVTHTEMSVGGKLYTADFSNYQSDRMEYHVNFPHKIIEKIDGTTVADLTVESHLPGPYAVWPIPAQLKPSASK
jgi:hypothetical protein